jgi:hypothetical protein
MDVASGQRVQPLLPADLGRWPHRSHAEQEAGGIELGTARRGIQAIMADLVKAFGQPGLIFLRAHASSQRDPA